MKNEKDSLGDRMKRYEAATTEQYFMPELPLYARLDGRAFHTFTRGLGKPYPGAKNMDFTFFNLMALLCQALVKDTNADLGYVQSDEISLGWKDVKSAPFDCRKFKMESVFASLAGARFMQLINKEQETVDSSRPFAEIRRRAEIHIPCFDCRVIQLPNLVELANAFVWRENDAIKNSISSYAMELFSDKELHGKTQKERLEMLREKGMPWESLLTCIRRGHYFAKVNYEVEGPNGEKAIRSRVDHVLVNHDQLAKIENKVGYLFDGEEPILLDRSLGESGDSRKVKA